MGETLQNPLPRFLQIAAGMDDVGAADICCLRMEQSLVDGEGRAVNVCQRRRIPAAIYKHPWYAHHVLQIHTYRKPELRSWVLTAMRAPATTGTDVPATHRRYPITLSRN